MHVGVLLHKIPESRALSTFFVLFWFFAIVTPWNRKPSGCVRIVIMTSVILACSLGLLETRTKGSQPEGYPPPPNLATPGPEWTATRPGAPSPARVAGGVREGGDGSRLEIYRVRNVTDLKGYLLIH